MKKIMTVISITVLFVLLSTKYDVSAVTPSLGSNTCYVSIRYYESGEYKGVNWYLFTSPNSINVTINSDGRLHVEGNNVTMYVLYFNQEDTTDGWQNMGGYGSFNNFYSWDIIAIIGGNYSNEYNPNIQHYDTIEDYENAINPEPSWYESMWDDLGDALGDPNFWFGEWFIDIIDNIFGNDEGGGPSEHSITTHVQIENPTITPAPTPIPYSTVIIPKTDPVSGDTYYETNYYYNNPSGTPIVQPYPPTNSPSTTSSPNSPEYIPVDGDPFSIPIVNWLTNATIGDTNYDGIDSVGSGLDSIDTIGSEYNDGMSAVQDATGILPTSWLLLIGIAAAIPLIAGIISRFLS